MKDPLTFLPAPELQNFINSYAILEVPEGETEPYFSPPLALSGFIINTVKSKGKLESMLKGKDFFTASAVATGQVTSPVYGKISGYAKSIMVFFDPLGMHQLFGNDMSQLTDDSQTLCEFLGDKEATALTSSLFKIEDNAQQVEVLNTFFKSKISSKKEIKKIKEILEFIHEKNGDVVIKDIEEKFHCQRKTLERHFKKMLGLSPKVYCKIYQFKCLINYLQQHPGITWTQLADQVGYYDQSHMSRYVKEYLKVSPNSMVKLDMDFINYLLSR